MKWSIPVVLFLAITLALPGWHEAPRSRAATEYVRTFAKLYGYVRYFHPSDQAAETNWDVFAVHGVRSVQQATGADDLLERLRDLFGPIAPTVDVFRTAEGPPPLPAGLAPDAAEDLNLVAWQYRGVGTGRTGTYASSRLNRNERDEPLFAAQPEPGEVRIKSIGSGLSVRLPIGLYSRDGRTLGMPDQDDLKGFRTTLDSFQSGDLWPENEAVRLASVVVAWNVVQHFFPYFDVVDADWEAVLTATLEDALGDADIREFLETLKGMLAHLEDGHAHVGHAVTRNDAWFSFRPEVIEGQLVVVATHFSSQFRVGDVITSVDGRPSLEFVAEEMNRWSGSEWWRRHRALSTFGRGPRGKEAEIGLVRDGQELELTETRTISTAILEERPPRVTEIEPGIFYVNLGRAEMAEIRRRIDDLSRADGVIFDLRGYPNANHTILSHLTDTTIYSASWDVPQVIYPDREGLTFDTTRRWTVAPAEPRITGKVVFLTDESAISYAESVMGIVEAYRLGEIIGRPTAGTNGNVVRLMLPGVVSMSFTGMRVQKHDNSRLYGVGVQPTIPLARTIAAVREGRDEHIEKAIELIRASR